MTYELKRKFEYNQGGAVRAVRYNIDGNYCLLCTSDRKLMLYNPKSGLNLKAYCGHGDEVFDAVSSCDSSFLLSGSADKSIMYWDVSTGLPVRRLRTHAAAVLCVKFNEDSSVAVSGSRDNSVQLFDIRSRALEPIQKLTDAKDCITSLIVHGHKIISSSLDGIIRHYDIRVGQLTSDKIGIPITYLSITSDEQCLLASCSDEAIRLIDIEGGEILTEYKGHHKGSKDFKIECGVLKGDNMVISGSNGGRAIIYDFVEGTKLKHLTIGPENSVTQSLTLHPTRDEMLIANRREIQLWTSASVEIIEDE